MRRSSAVNSHSMTGMGRSGGGPTTTQGDILGTSEGVEVIGDVGGVEEEAGAEGEITGGSAGKKTVPQHQPQLLHHPWVVNQQL